MTSSRSLLSALALGVALAASAPAWAAGPTAQDLETARTLYKEGKDLRAKGDLKGALAKLLAAHSLGHTPLTGIELARVQANLGMFVEARETCLGVARMPVEADETARSADARTDAAKLADQLKPAHFFAPHQYRRGRRRRGADRDGRSPSASRWRPSTSRAR